VEIGQQLSAFKAEMFVKLERAMVRELAALSRTRAGIANRPIASAAAKR
jgi:hypothetical protein